MVFARARDLAGNVSAYSAGDTSTTVDTEPPQGSLTIDGGAQYAASPQVTLGLSAVDATSGVAAMSLGNDEASLGSFEPYTTTQPWTLAPGEGVKVVYAEFKDGARNTSGIVSDTIVLTQTPPSGNLTINGGSLETV
jgi:hypothetical protein